MASKGPWRCPGLVGEREGLRSERTRPPDDGVVDGNAALVQFCREKEGKVEIPWLERRPANSGDSGQYPYDDPVQPFNCDNCGQQVFFENLSCLRCGSGLGYRSDRRTMATLWPDTSGLRTSDGRAWKRCATTGQTGCNWLVAAGAGPFCDSCRLTRTRPADTDLAGMAELPEAEQAKRRLIHQLAELGLRLARRDDTAGTGVAFDLLSSSAQRVVTGHDDGVITLDLAEADEVHRERLRLELNEPYRTLLGHFRHEIGHYFWPILVRDRAGLDACRQLFGDERESYAAALERHYQQSDSDQSWVNAYVSRYATMHPYEDWAETFAHYLHIQDTLETAHSFGLALAGEDPTRADDDFDRRIGEWLDLSRALNEINRSMGRPDLYPFILSAAVIRKLAFVEQVIKAGREASS